MSDNNMKKHSGSMIKVNKNPGIKVQSRIVNAIRNGHPWIFRNSLVNPDIKRKTGTIVDVLDEEKNFLGRGFFEEEGAVAIRLMTRKKSELINDEFILKYLKRALDIRKHLKDEGQTVYRIINAEADRFPGMTVTRFGDYLLSILYTEGAYAYRDKLYEELMSTGDFKGIYEQERLRPLGKTKIKLPGRLVKGSQAPLEVEIMEDDMKFTVDLTAPAGVGFFPDYRNGRRLIRKMSEGKRVLNLFSYTGAFSLSASKGGAERVVSVDVSQKINTKAASHFKLNNMSLENAKFITEDAPRFVSKLVRRGEIFDLAIVDPPAFANGNNVKWSLQKNYHELIKDLCDVIKPGGHILLTSNVAKMTREEFERIIAYGTRFHTAVIIDRISLPHDYPQLPAFTEGNYLKSYLVRID